MRREMKNKEISIAQPPIDGLKNIRLIQENPYINKINTFFHQTEENRK